MNELLLTVITSYSIHYTKLYEYPLITKQRMFYESMEEILPDLTVIIDNTESGIQKILPLDSFVNYDTESGTVSQSSGEVTNNE